MAFDYFTIRALAVELSADLTGRRLVQATSAGDDLALACDTSRHVVAVLGSGRWLYRASGAIPDRVACADGGEPYLVGSRVESVLADERDRIIRLRLTRKNRGGADTYGLLILELFSPRWRAALASEQTGHMLGVWPSSSKSWPGRRLVPGSSYALPGGGTRLLPGADALSSFVDAVRELGGPLARGLCRVLAGADRHVVAEIGHAAGVSVGRTASEADAAMLERLWEAAGQVYTSEVAPGGHVWTADGGLAFSALRPTRPVVGCRSFESVSEAIGHCRERAAEGAAREHPTGHIMRGLRQQQRVLERRQMALRGDLEEAAQADELERLGSILMAHLALVPPGAREARLPDSYDATGKREVIVTLNPERTAATNAARMLKRAKRYRRRQQVLPTRLEGVEAEAAELSAVLDRLARGETVNDSDVQRWNRTRDGSGRRQSATQAHPRRYVTSSGWTVLAGRSNVENDILTHRVAAQEDIWFHASGYPGSHIILRREGRRDEPGARTLAEAAGVAAYWSKGRSAKSVPVVYTRAKYVTKPRGAPPGMATPRRAKTLMVAPALLPEARAREPQG